ncbi:MAG: hypothetical protein JO218_18610 [Burkholderiales bacterium]|nr:hypothetical protein [Burkholderiales bacterium]
MATQTLGVANQESVAFLLYLYIWPFWMFKDVSKGNLLEQAAAYRYNREKRVYLPGYIARWACIFGLSLASVNLIENLARSGMLVTGIAVLLAGLSGVFASWAFVVVMQITVAYIFLCRWRHL